MGGLFHSPKRAKIPAAAEPEPSPQPIDVEVMAKETARRRSKLKKFGRESTILTMGGLGASEASQKGTLLGGNA